MLDSQLLQRPPDLGRMAAVDLAPGSYGVRFVKPFFQHLVVSPRWKEGAEGWSCWSSLSEREAKRDYDPIQGWSHSYRPNWPASSYPAEREALNHHALVRQGRGPRRQVQIFATALKPEPGAAHCHLGAVRKRRWVAFLLISTVLALCSSLSPLAARLKLQRAVSRAPAGTSPVSARRHSAITSLRMSATIRTFFMRPLAPPRRALNHCASALSG